MAGQEYCPCVLRPMLFDVCSGYFAGARHYFVCALSYRIIFKLLINSIEL